MNDAIPQFLATIELFAHVPEDALRQIAAQCQVQKVYPNVAVFEQGTVAERLYIVYQGSVALRRRDTLTGMEFLLALYGKGKSFGEEGVISDLPYPVSAHATEETHLIALEKADLRRVMQALPQVSIACARIMARRTNRFVAEKGIRYISLSKLQIDPEVLKMLPARMIREHKVLPIAMRGKTLTVAMVDPHNLVAYDEVQRGARDYYVEPVGISESDYEKFMRVHVQALHAPDDEGGNVLPPMPSRNHSLRFMQEGAENIQESERTGNVGGEQVIAMLNQIIGDALVLDASDIHLEPGDEAAAVRFRIDGKLYRRAESVPMRYHNPLITRIKALASMDITERRKPLDGRLGLMFNEREVSLRISTVPTRFGENLVVRVLDKSAALMSLDRIVLVPGVREMIRSLIFQPHGIVLVTGPTGSGKTTTMYSAIMERKDEGVNIVTIEDPIEYTIGGITQVQYNEGIGLGYAEAVRAFLRQDTDIMLIGETRDARTAHNAMQAALSGHLVVTSLHTNSALGSVYRLKEMGIEQFLIANALSGVIAQRLVRTVCNDCREPFDYSPALIGRLYTQRDEVPQLYRGRGCARCGDSGYRGRTAVLEVLQMTEELRAEIGAGASMATLRRVAAKGGMVTFRDYARFLLSRGLTTPNEVLRVLYVEQDVASIEASSIKCDSCGHINARSNKFCEECGHHFVPDEAKAP